MTIGRQHENILRRRRESTPLHDEVQILGLRRIVQIVDCFIVGAIHRPNGFLLILKGGFGKDDYPRIDTEITRADHIVTARCRRDARHRLRQNCRSEISAAEHLKTYRNLRNDNLCDILFTHSVGGENLIRHILDDRVLGNGDLLATQISRGGNPRTIGCNEIVIAVRIGNSTDIKSAGTGENHSQKVRHRSIEISALQCCITIHCTLERLQLYLDAFLSKVAAFRCNNERNRVRIGHQPDGQLRERLTFLLHRSPTASHKEQRQTK